MSNQDQPRVVKGTPKRGGQWSGKHTSEAADVELTDSEVLPDVAAVVSSSDWAKIGVTDPTALADLAVAGWRPEDLDSDNPMIRVAVHIDAGTMVLDGKLLLNGLELYRYDSDLDTSRVFYAEETVRVGGETMRWADLDGEEQMEYISGYAAAAAGRARPRVPEASLAASGWDRGERMLSAKRKIDEGRTSGESFAIVDPETNGRCLVVTDSKPDPVLDGYTGKVAAGQYRRHYDVHGSERAVPWKEGVQVFFRADELGA